LESTNVQDEKAEHPHKDHNRTKHFRGTDDKHRMERKHKKDHLLQDGDSIVISGSGNNTVIVNSNNVDNGDGNNDGNNDGNGNGNGNGKFMKTMLTDTIIISDNNSDNNILDHADNSDDNNSN